MSNCLQLLRIKKTKANKLNNFYWQKYLKKEYQLFKSGRKKVFKFLKFKPLFSFVALSKNMNHLKFKDRTLSPNLLIIYKKIGIWLIINKDGLPLATNEGKILKSSLKKYSAILFEKKN